MTTGTDPSNPLNPAMSQFDGPQVLRKGFDDTTDALRVEQLSQPLPTNAAKERLGNLDQVVDLLSRCLMELRAIRFATGTMASGGACQMNDCDPAVTDFSND